MSAPLAGLTVVSFEQAVAAPYCTSRLVQDGARVIKIERTEGDFARGYDATVHGQSSYFVWLNAGKESIALDLKDANDSQLALNMLRSADIVVQNFAPGALARIGIDLASERNRRPALITLGISGYGPTGPYSDMKAYDLLIQAESGLCSVTGTPDAAARVGVSICDIATGMQAYSAILRALVQRGVSRLGASIEISMFDAMTEWMAVPLLQSQGGKAPSRMGVAHPSIAPYGVFDTSEGAQILIAVQSEREWKILAGNLLPNGTRDDPRFATNVLRCANRAVLDALIARVFSARNLDNLTAELKRNRIAFSQLRTLPEVLAHPVYNPLPITLGKDTVMVPAPGSGRSTERNLAVPTLNQHGAVLRAEFAR